MATKSLVKAASGEIANTYDRFAAPVVNVEQGSGLPFVGFLHTTAQNADKAAEIRSACGGLPEGDPYLSARGSYFALSPFKYHLLAAQQFWIQRDAQGKTILSVLDSDPGSYSDPHKEDVIAALLVYDGDTLTPALCSFRTTKAGGVHAACKALNQATDNETWGAKGAEYKATLRLKCPPFGRFTTTVTLRKSVAKNGNPLYLASGAVKATTPGEADVLGAFLGDAKNAAAVAAVMASFDAKVSELQKAVQK